jgi:hypothetical protein
MSLEFAVHHAFGGIISDIYFSVLVDGVFGRRKLTISLTPTGILH